MRFLVVWVRAALVVILVLISTIVCVVQAEAELPACGQGEVAVKTQQQIGVTLAIAYICVKADTPEAVTAAAEGGSPNPCRYVSYNGTGDPKGIQALKSDSGLPVDGLSAPAGQTFETGYLLFAKCDGQLTYTRQWVQNGQPPLANPLDLALQARSSVTVTTPAMSISPDWTLKDGRKATLKKAQTWFWVSETSTWTVLTPRVDAGPVWAQATITPIEMVIDPHDGATPALTCSGPGSVIPTGTPMTSKSPDCSLAFLQQTDGATWPVSVAVRFSVTWTGFDGTQTVGGTLDPLVSAPVVYPLAVITAKTQLIDPNGPRS